MGQARGIRTPRLHLLFRGHHRVRPGLSADRVAHPSAGPGANVCRDHRGPRTRPLEFEPRLDLGEPGARGIGTIVNTLLSYIDTLPAQNRSLVISELEEALIVALLAGAPHTLRDQLARRVDRAATWQVRRVEEFIDANCERAIGIEDLVEQTGSSARSIYRAFKEHRGYTPMEFVMRAEGWSGRAPNSPILPTD